MSKIIEIIKNSNNLHYLGKCNFREIEAAEKEMGMALASDFKEYVQEFGIASFDGHELTGLCKSERLNVVSATQRIRNQILGIPENSYVLEECNIDDIVVWQKSDGTVFETFGGKIGSSYSSIYDYLTNK